MEAKDHLEVLWEKDQLMGLILDFGWALDSGDWDLYQSCLSDPVRIDFKRLTGVPEVEVSAADWTEFARHALMPVRRHHSYTNFRIEVAKHTASARVHMVARHFLPSDNGSAENTQYGWYEFAFIRGPDETWKIRRLKHSFQWVSGNAGLLDFTIEPVASAAARVFNAANMVS